MAKVKIHPRAGMKSITRPEDREQYDAMYRKELRKRELAMERIRNINGSFYEGVDPRRRQELADGGLIREDQRAMANLPTRAIHHEYPRMTFWDTPYIDALREEEF